MDGRGVGQIQLSADGIPDRGRKDGEIVKIPYQGINVKLGDTERGREQRMEERINQVLRETSMSEQPLPPLPP